MDSKEDDFKQMRKVKKQLEQALALKARVDAGEIVPNSEQLEKIKRLRKLQKDYDSFPAGERVAEEVVETSGTTLLVAETESAMPRSYAAVAAPEPLPAPEIPPTHFTTSVRAKCDECQRKEYLDCISNHRDGKLYCLRCWADFLLTNKVTCSICKRSMASLRDPATNNNECRKCFRKRMGGKAIGATPKQRQAEQQQPPGDSSLSLPSSPPPVVASAAPQAPLYSSKGPIRTFVTIAAAAGLVVVIAIMARPRRS